MKVGLYLRNKNISEIDLSKPEEGNPGIGGTEYNFLTLPVYFNKYHTDEVEFVWYANSIEKLPKEINAIEVENCLEAVQMADKDKCDFLIWRPTTDRLGRKFIDRLDTYNISIIAWVHNTPADVNILDKMANAKNIKRFVCVSQEQLDRLRDHSIYYKSVCIFNGFDPRNYIPDNKLNKKGNKVVYVGSLVPAKGFHHLARVWPDIKKEVPAAKLNVIGSGKLYDRSQKLGKWGIAEEAYENKWRKYLTGPEGGIDKSVEFKGTLGLEKIDIIQKADVGVVNPSGKTENCPGSAIEFQAAGVPVVSGAYRGLLDTVVDKKTGLLGKGDKELANNISYLLKDKKTAEKFGENGITYVKQKFSYKKISQQWLDLFRDVENGEPVDVEGIKQFPFNDKKIIREGIRLFSKYLFKLPSIKKIKYSVRKVIKH